MGGIDVVDRVVIMDGVLGTLPRPASDLGLLFPCSSFLAALGRGFSGGRKGAMWERSVG
jgi:hypothetical protein